MATRHRLVFVPLNQATVGPGYVKVAYDKKQVKDAPAIGTDGELPAGDEQAIFKPTAWPASQALAVCGGWPAAEPPG